MFTNGQKIICINDSFEPSLAKLYINLPKKDQVYVVRDMCVGISPRGEEGEIAVYLVGLKNPTSFKPPYAERGFKIERFTPLETMTETEYEEQEDLITV